MEDRVGRSQGTRSGVAEEQELELELSGVRVPRIQKSASNSLRSEPRVSPPDAREIPKPTRQTLSPNRKIQPHSLEGINICTHVSRPFRISPQSPSFSFPCRESTIGPLPSYDEPSTSPLHHTGRFSCPSSHRCPSGPGDRSSKYQLRPDMTERQLLLYDW
jgi:hypothetical protein